MGRVVVVVVADGSVVVVVVGGGSGISKACEIRFTWFSVR